MPCPYHLLWFEHPNNICWSVQVTELIIIASPLLCVLPLVWDVLQDTSEAGHDKFRAPGKRLLGRCKCIWEDNIRMDLRETVMEGVDWIRLAQDRWPVADSFEHGNGVP
jgi:hypothetical protein